MHDGISAVVRPRSQRSSVAHACRALLITVTAGAVGLAGAPPVLAESTGWESYVPAPARPFVTPVAVTSVAGDVRDPQALVRGSGTTTLTRAPGGPAPVLLLDYGREVGGAPHFQATGVTGTPTLHTAYSESRRWSTGPTSALSDYVLGITPTEPGYRRWNLTPHRAI
ncbi:hypothetical protein [Nocardia jiangxiensis]|uniref:Uncharacterized protein n=1 Tax=Nocardia jiangxiensis TaxID=282685 RepID=A0ABW6S7P0_9NOCA|nr:hypothetical protein [Nocardia jiangxiensis]